MKKQLVFIHGGEAYSEIHDYEIALEQAQVSLEQAEKKRWHYVPALQNALGVDWEIFRPEMPCADNAKYEHWKMWFEKYIPYMNDGVVLVGHSLGAMFLARYLSENLFPKKIAKLVLLAPQFTRPASKSFGQEDGEFFYTHLDNFSRLDQVAEKLYLLHSVDDPVVAVSSQIEFANRLPSARIMTFEDKSHFWDSAFPEIITLLKEE